MTCIIGLETNSGVVMGADSMASGGWDKNVSRVEKVFIKDDRFLIGYTSSFRMGQLIQYSESIPQQSSEQKSDFEYMVTVFIESIRKILKEGGYTKIDSNQEEGGQFLVGYNKRLYQIDDDFQVNSFTTGFGAVGCGHAYAKGAMMALEGLPPVGRIEGALKIAAEFSNGVCGPWLIKNIQLKS